jgi:hypothetical protein
MHLLLVSTYLEVGERVEERMVEGGVGERVDGGGVGEGV